MGLSVGDMCNLGHKSWLAFFGMGQVLESNMQNREDYWSTFYSGIVDRDVLQPPSQFAAFAAQEIDKGSVVFEVGCGNGRDSLFFAELGFKVVALDKSQNAIEATQIGSKRRGLKNIECITGDVSSETFASAIADITTQNVCVYARFFLHSITDEEQATFFETLSETLKPGHKLAFEYRTEQDQFLEKDAPPHFRRYQNASDLNDQLEAFGFKCLYQIEGQGYAKYKSEDAIVSRAIFEKI